MDSSRPLALPDWSAVPGNSDEDRRLMNRRLAYFGAVSAVISALFFVVVVAVNVLFGVSVGAFVRRPENVLHLAAILVFALEWLVCRGARRSPKELNAIDIGTTFGSLALFGTAFVLVPKHGFESALALTLITVSGLIMRAVFVPGTARRTFWVSVACSMPTLVATYVMACQAPETLAGIPWHVIGSCMYVGAWLAATVALATLASRIIYGLSQRVRAATELGQYTLEEKIGEGGMGVVYRARHALLRRPTAVKLLPPELAGERAVQRFEREVQLTSALTHPNTIAIYDYGRSPDGVFYYAMEYLEGITLEDLVAHDGPQPAGRVIHVLKQLCGALAEAHSVHLIHRDIKPANIVLCERGGLADYVKVLDFGLVKEVATADPQVSAAQTIVGTPAYMAPEAITRPDAIDVRVDLYAVGAVAYELLAGTPLFEGATVLEVCVKTLQETPKPPSSQTGASPIPPELEALVLACLSKDPAQRPQSAIAISEALDKIREPWTPLDAKRWWKDRAPKVLSAVKAGVSHGDGASERRTVEVDLMKRYFAAAG
jgi:serine/threonine-protein kinase